MASLLRSIWPPTTSHAAILRKNPQSPGMLKCSPATNAAFTPSLPTHRHGDVSHNSLNLAPWPQQAGRNKLLRNTRLNIITTAQTTQAGKIIMVFAQCRAQNRAVNTDATLWYYKQYFSYEVRRGYRHHNPPCIWAHINYHAQHSRLFLRTEAIFGWGREVSLLQGQLAMSSALPIHEEKKKTFSLSSGSQWKSASPSHCLATSPGACFTQLNSDVS